MIESDDKILRAVLSEIHQVDGNFSIEQTIKSLTENWRKNPVTKPEVERAVAQCFEAKWIKTLTEQDCEEDRLRWLDDPHQNWSEGLYRVGRVDLTPAGYDVYAELQVRKWPLTEVYRQTVQNLWRKPGNVSLLSVSEKELISELADVHSGTDGLVDSGLIENHTLGEITGPYAIGAWWVNRFYLAPSGYRLDIAFEPADIDLD